MDSVIYLLMNWRQKVMGSTVLEFRSTQIFLETTVTDLKNPPSGAGVKGGYEHHKNRTGIRINT